MRDLSACIGKMFKRKCDTKFGWILGIGIGGHFILKSMNGFGTTLTHIEGSRGWDFRDENEWVMEEDDLFWNI